MQRMREQNKIKFRQVGKDADYLLESLPATAQVKYWSLYEPNKSLSKNDAEIYAAAPDHSRRKANKYLQIITESSDLSGDALKKFLYIWNREHPDCATSYVRLITARKNYIDHGVSALLGKWGKRSSSTSVPDNLFSFFKSLYMSDGRPSVVSCWKMTLGHAVGIGIDAATVPSHSAFARRLKNETPEQAVYTAREGLGAANRKHGFYIRRNYDQVLSGECWISDHAQVDIACTYNDRGKTRVGYPWITAWRDFKSGLWTGWDLHMENPNSDYIFMSFYRGALKYGIPSYLYLDNGKDYRCRDFAGGRKNHRLNVDEGITTSLTAALGITTIFAWPYNAQSKSIERDFLRQKEWLSKHAAGYRGGNVVERPEAHNKTISSGKIISIEELDEIMTGFINDVIMQSVVSSGYRAGKCPQEIWQEEYPLAIEQQKVRHISKIALMLFCTRVSGVLTIGRRGIRDNTLGIDYYGAWMEGQKGRKVYLRRDPKAMQEAWVFDAANNTYLDNAYLLPEVNALSCTNDTSSAELKDAIAIKRNANKIIKLLSRPDFEIPFNEKIQCLATATRALNLKRGYDQDQQSASNAPILLTDMDKVFSQRETNKKDGTMDISILTKQVEKEVKKRELRIFESDKQKVVNS